MRWEPSRRTSALSATVLACALAVAAIPSAVGTPAPVARGSSGRSGRPRRRTRWPSRTVGRLQGHRRPGVGAVPAGQGPQEEAAREDRAGAQGQVVRRSGSREPDHRGQDPRPRRQRAGGRPRGARADDRLPAGPVGAGGLRPPARPAEEQRTTRSGSTGSRAGIGDTHVVLVLQPDGPFALCAPGGSQLPSQLVGYAARRLQRTAERQRLHRRRRLRLAAQRPQALEILLPAGIDTRAASRSTRRTTPRPRREIAFGAAVVAGPGRGGVRRQALRRQHRGQRRAVQRLRLRRPELRQRRDLQDQGPAGAASRSASRRPPTSPTRPGACRRPTRQRGGVRRRLPLGRPALALHAGRPVRPDERALAVARTTPY